MQKKFELFMCCLGNGTTVCNKAVMENGDYKVIAHISNGGNIRLYVSESYIPDTEMEKIKAMANRDKAEFMKRFENLPEVEQYAEKTGLLDSIPENLRYYFDFETFGRDMEIEGTYIFYNGDCYEVN